MSQIINIAFTDEEHKWIAGFSQAIGRPMDRTLVLLAMTGMKHYRECVRLPENPAAYRAAIVEPTP